MKQCDRRSPRSEETRTEADGKRVRSVKTIAIAIAMLLVLTSMSVIGTSPAAAQLTRPKIDPEVTITVHSVPTLTRIVGSEARVVECLLELFPGGRRLPATGNCSVSTGDAGPSGGSTFSAARRDGRIVANEFLGAVTEESPRRDGYVHRLELWNVEVVHDGNQDCSGFSACNISDGDTWFDADVVFHVWRRRPPPPPSSGNDTCSEDSGDCMEIGRVLPEFEEIAAALKASQISKFYDIIAGIGNQLAPDLLKVGQTIRMDAGTSGVKKGWRELSPRETPNKVRLFSSGGGRVLAGENDRKDRMARDSIFTSDSRRLNISFPSADRRRYDITVLYSRRDNKKPARARLNLLGHTSRLPEPSRNQIVRFKVSKVDSEGDRALITIGGRNLAVQGVIIKRVD